MGKEYMSYISWTLVMYLSMYGVHGGPAVIDDIATEAECKRVSEEIRRLHGVNMKTYCIETTKKSEAQYDNNQSH